MIRLRDGLTIASTKLKTHKVRTGIAVGVSGVMFGLLILAIVVFQGVFDSINRFSDEGINNRTLLSISIYIENSESPYFLREDQKFVSMVEEAYTKRILNKKVLAKKHGVEFDERSDDLSPVTYDKTLKQKVIGLDALNSPDVISVFEANFTTPQKMTSIHDVLKPYQSSKLIQEIRSVSPSNGEFKLMTNGKEELDDIQKLANPGTQYGDNGEGGPINIIEESIAQPFLTASFDTRAGRYQ